MELGGGGGEDREGSVLCVCACVCLCVLLRVRAFQKISKTKSQTCGLDRGGCDPAPGGPKAVATKVGYFGGSNRH
jgi:hypothetical protein